MRLFGFCFKKSCFNEEALPSFSMTPAGAEKSSLKKKNQHRETHMSYY
jgi:hypothetical protein